MRIVGIDLSLKRTGIAIAGHDLIVWSIEPEETWPIEQRIALILQTILRHVNPGCSVFIENHSFGSRGQGVRQLAELVGAVKNGLYACNVTFRLVSPLTLKKWATGYGGSKKKPVDKALVLHRIAVKTGIEPQNSDEADALSLADFGWHVLNPDEPQRELTDIEKDTIRAFLAPKVKKPRKKRGE